MFRRTECHIGRGSQRTGTSRAVRHHHRRCSLSHFENAVFTPLYVSHITGFQKTAFYKGMFGPLAAAVFAWAVCRGIRLFSPLDSWAGLIAAGLAVCMSYAAFAFSSFVRKKKGGLLYRNAEK